MAIQSSIATLYKDKEKTQAILPKTNTSAVLDENGVGLNSILDTCVYQKGFEGDIIPLKTEDDLSLYMKKENYAEKDSLDTVKKATLSENSNKLNNQTADYYATKENINNVADSVKIYSCIFGLKEEVRNGVQLHDWINRSSAEPEVWVQTAVCAGIDAAWTMEAPQFVPTLDRETNQKQLDLLNQMNEGFLETVPNGIKATIFGKEKPNCEIQIRLRRAVL